MANYTLVGIDPANPNTHSIIDIDRAGQIVRLSVFNGTEEDSACDVLGLPKPEPVAPPADPVTPEDAAAND